MFGWPNSQSTNLANNIACLQSNLLSRAKAPPAKRNRRLWGGEWKPSNCLRSKKDGSYRLFLSLFLTVAAIWILNTQSSGGYEPFVPRPENNPVRSEDSIKFLRNGEIFYTFRRVRFSVIFTSVQTSLVRNITVVKMDAIF